MTAFQATAFQSTAFQVEGGIVAVPLPSGGGASRAHGRRLRQSLERRQRFEDERRERVAAIGVEVERLPLKPAPETVAMIARVLDEPIAREFEKPATAQDDGGEEELLLLLLEA